MKTAASPSVGRRSRRLAGGGREPIPIPSQRRSPTEAAHRGDRVVLQASRRPAPRIALGALSALTLAPVLLGALLGHGRTPPAVAAIEVRLAASAAASSEQADRDAATQLALLTSPAVLAPVSVQEGLPLHRLRSSVSARTNLDGDLVQVEVQDASPQRALRVAAAVAQAWEQLAELEVVTPRSLQFYRDRIAQLEAAAEAVQQRVGVLYNDRLARSRDGVRLEPSAEERRLQIRLEVLEGQIGRAQDGGAGLLAAGASVQQPKIVTPAYLLPAGRMSSTLQGAAAGVLLGAALGALGYVLLLRPTWSRLSP